jgi:hypothetical protein
VTVQRPWKPPSGPTLRAVVTVGWREWVAFPEWGVPAMKAKIDTGARTSALHATDLEHFERDGAAWTSFVVHPWQATDDDATRVEAPVVDEREVTSSSGTTSLRTVVAATIQLDNVPRLIEVTLTRRDDMGFRMLIGREALRGHFVVDPERSYLTGRPSKELRRKNRDRP